MFFQFVASVALLLVGISLIVFGGHIPRPLGR